MHGPTDTHKHTHILKDVQINQLNLYMINVVCLTHVINLCYSCNFRNPLYADLRRVIINHSFIGNKQFSYNVIQEHWLIFA